MAKPKKGAASKKAAKKGKPAAPKSKGASKKPGLAKGKTAPSKKVAPAKKAAPAKKVAPKQAAQPSGTAELTLGKLAARWPALSELELEAFSSLASDAQCDDLGRRTRAAEVRDEAVRWAIEIDGAVRSYPGALENYAPKRLSFLLHTARDLTRLITTEGARRDQVSGARSSVLDARQAAIAARATTIERLTTFAGIRAAERAALSNAMGDVESVDGLARSLRSLSHLEREWLERTDPVSVVLAQTAGLSVENADELRLHAGALGAKKVDATLEGRRLARDTPQMNRLEGRILFELREARRIFNAAHERNGVVPRLNPSANLRLVLGKATNVTAPKPAEDDGQDTNIPPLTDGASAPV